MAQEEWPQPVRGLRNYSVLRSRTWRGETNIRVGLPNGVHAAAIRGVDGQPNASGEAVAP